jgi:hypothetical protein
MNFDKWLYANYGLSKSLLSQTDYIMYQYEWIQKTSNKKEFDYSKYFEKIK